MSKTDKVEYEKRIRIIQEWIIDDWPYTDIIMQIFSQWGVQSRQAKRYVADARDRWVEDQDQEVDKKRALKVESLKKLKRTLKELYKGTPSGIRATIAVEKELIKLQGLGPAKKVELGGIKDAVPIPVAGSITHNLIVKRCEK